MHSTRLYMVAKEVYVRSSPFLSVHGSRLGPLVTFNDFEYSVLEISCANSHRKSFRKCLYIERL